MAIYLFLTIICVAQLCGAQSSFKPEDGVSVDTDPEFNTIPTSDTIHTSPESGTDEEKEPSYKWKAVRWPTRSLPSDVVVGGIDDPYGCGMVYVGRAWYNGSLLPAKICGSDGRAFVSHDDSEVMLNESEVLCTENALWKPIKEGQIPKNSFQVGNTENGKILYLGRWFLGTILTPGKVETNSKTLHMTYNQHVYHSSQYEILIIE